MKVGRLLLVAGLLIPLLLAAGAWFFRLSGSWRLLAAAGLALLFWALVLLEHVRYTREHDRSERLRL